MTLAPEGTDTDRPVTGGDTLAAGRPTAAGGQFILFYFKYLKRQADANLAPQLHLFHRIASAHRLRREDGRWH